MPMLYDVLLEIKKINIQVCFNITICRHINKPLRDAGKLQNNNNNGNHYHR